MKLSNLPWSHPSKKEILIRINVNVLAAENEHGDDNEDGDNRDDEDDDDMVS